MSSLPPGWYKDPADPSTQRWWDGEGWLGKAIPADQEPPAGPPPAEETQQVTPGPVAPPPGSSGLPLGYPPGYPVPPPGWTPPPGWQPAPGWQPPPGYPAPPPAGWQPPPGHSMPPGQPAPPPGQPAAGQPAPLPGQPAPAPGQPAAGQPAAGQPAAGQPAAGQPVPSSGQPSTPAPGGVPVAGQPSGWQLPPGYPVPPPGWQPPPGWTPPPGVMFPYPVQARPHGMALAGLGRRLVARLVDIVAVVLLNVVVNGWLAYQWWLEVEPLFRAAMTEPFTTPQPASVRSSYIMLTMLFVATALWFAYEVPAVANSGQTLGKRLLQVKVVKLEDTAPLGFGRAFRRWARLGMWTPLWSCYGIGFLAQLIDSGSVLFDQRLHQALHDKSAGTVVVAAPPGRPQHPVPAAPGNADDHTGGN
ncbi:RDD family protein [Actinoplanes sp. NPDC049548]|uniref:RDD family protein n=1 Tax=Actinoplanes sp. NPDC049548 TaxID=3155152 RepID=UPI0034379CAD